MSSLPPQSSALKSGMTRLLIKHAILTLSLLLLLGGGVMLYYFQQQQQQLVQNLTLQNARLYIDALSEFRTLYTDTVVSAAHAQGIEISHDIEARSDVIPLPATLSMLLGNRLTTTEDGGSARLYSPYPFPWRALEGGLKDQFDRDAWAFLQQNPNQAYFRFERQGEQSLLRYAKADLMRSSCVACHNSHQDSPKRDWSEGDVRGILSVSLPLAAVEEEASSSLQGPFIFAALLGLLAISGLTIVIQRLRASVQETELANEQLAEEVSIRWQAEHLSKRRSEQLEVSNQKLEAANRELMEFNYVASHDLQEPLRTLGSFVTLLKEDLGDDLPKDAEDDMHFISEASARMRSLVQDLLTLSRTNTYELCFEPVDLNLCMEEISANLKSSLDDSGGQLSWRELPMVDGDKSQLTRVLQNLVSNALKFHSERAPVVEVAAQQHRGYWKITVTDNGIGIEPEYQQQIFSAFKRLHGTSQYEGTGIGLAIVRRIIERHKGHLGVESELGQGAQFWFCLPAQD